MKPVKNDDLYLNIKNILQSARDNAYRQVNFIMVEAYWNIGQQIVEEEQNGKDRAEYGSYLIKELSSKLSKDFGTGFSKQNLWNMRQFYNCFPILSSLRRELSWTHYKMILRVENKNARDWYADEAVASNWSTRALERQIGTHYYERLLSSKEKLSTLLTQLSWSNNLLILSASKNDEINRINYP